MTVHYPILFDATRLAARFLEGRLPTGIDRVAYAYLAQYRQHSRALVRHREHWLELDEKSSEQLFAALQQEVTHPRAALRKAVARAYILPDRARHPRILLNVGHMGLDHQRHERELRKRGLRPVYFVHDLIPLTYPEYCRAGETAIHKERIETMLRLGAGLILNSRATLYDLQYYAARLGLFVPPHVVAPIGADNLPEPSPQPPLTEPYFVMVGTIDPRKNHLLLLHLWRAWAGEGGSVPKLVLIGQRGWECEQVVDLLERCPAMQDHVLERNDCSDAELVSWLQHARALLFPSFAEGYGMPLVEALGHGVPVIASDLPVFREIAGSIPDYLDPLDGPAWLRLLRSYAAPDSAERGSQIQRLQHFRVPNWQHHFQLVDAFLEERLPQSQKAS